MKTRSINITSNQVSVLLAALADYKRNQVEPNARKSLSKFVGDDYSAFHDSWACASDSVNELENQLFPLLHKFDDDERADFHASKSSR